MAFKSSAAPGTDRMVACPRCGATVTITHPSGRERCDGCGRVVQVDAFIAPRALSEQEDAARMAKLAKAARRGTRARRYAFSTLRELGLEGRPWPETIGPLRAELQRARERLVEEQEDERERRFWELALVVASGEGVLGRDPKRRVRVLEDALPWVEDGGRRDVMCCHLSRAYAELGDLDAAAAWLSRTDPAPTVLEVHTERTATSASLALRSGDPAGALALVGAREEDVLLSHHTSALCAQLRIAALEELGRAEEADAELGHACRLWGQYLILSWMKENRLAPRAVERFLASLGEDD